MALASTVLPTAHRLAQCETARGNGRAPTHHPRRRIGLKELSWLFDLTERQLRRLQNEARVIVAIRRQGSCRILDYSDEELAKLAAIRLGKGKGFDRAAAEHLGCLKLLDQVAAEIDRDSAATDPDRYGEVRVQLLLELALLNADSPLARKMGLTPMESSFQADTARRMLAELIAEMPSVSAGMAEVLQAGLVAQGIQRGKKTTDARSPRKSLRAEARHRSDHKINPQPH